jgi:cytochrome c oxidase subunit 2
MQRLRAISILAIAGMIALLLTSSAASAKDKLPVPADEFVYCTVCHGVQLMGNASLGAPRLSAMEAWYVERQLQAFKQGWRGKHTDDNFGLEMQPMADVLAPEQIEAVAKFVARTRSEAPTPTVTGNAERGKALYRTCAACHGENAQGNETFGGPALSGVNDWYLAGQLQNYRNGVRGEHPQDNFGRQMRSAMNVLVDTAAIDDVVSYITSLRAD